MSNFTIILPDVWEPSAYYEAEELSYVGLEPVEAAIWEFAKKYDLASWYIKADDKTYALWGGDISYLWGDIPTWLEDIRTGDEIAWIKSHAQGSEATIVVESFDTQTVKVLIINHDTQP